MKNHAAQNNFSNSTTGQLNLRPVPRVGNLSAAEFRDSYVKRNRPVVFKDVARCWPAFKKWTPEYFARKYGSLQVKIYDRSFIEAGASYMSSLRKIPFKDYLDLMLNNSADLRLFAFNIFWQAPELRQDILWPTVTQGFSREFIFMFFGCRGSVTPLHYDPDLPHIMHTVLYGRKRVILFPHEESRNLYKHPFNTRSYVDVDNPDFVKFPRLQATKGYHVLLRPGETLFMPSGYWHHMVYDEAGYSVCIRSSRLPLTRKLRAYRNMLICFPIDKIMNKLCAEAWFRWKEQRAQR